MVRKLKITDTSKEYLIHLPLFEEEVQHMIQYVQTHPKATEKELETEVERKTWEVTQKVGMTADERDCYRG